LWALGMLRFEQVMRQVVAFRYSNFEDQDPGFPGLFGYQAFLAEQVPPDEELRPVYTKQADGDFIVDWMAPDDRRAGTSSHAAQSAPLASGEPQASAE
jgi:hypothetical protein